MPDLPYGGFGPIFSLNGVTPTIAADAFIAPTCRGDRRRGGRFGNRHLVPLPRSRRPEFDPHWRAHQHPGRHDHPCRFRGVLDVHRRRRDGRAQCGDPRLHAEEPRVRRHQRDGAGWRGDRGGRDARGRRAADSGESDRSERVMDRFARETSPRDGCGRTQAFRPQRRSVSCDWRDSFARVCGRLGEGSSVDQSTAR